MVRHETFLTTFHTQEDLAAFLDDKVNNSLLQLWKIDYIGADTYFIVFNRLED